MQLYTKEETIGQINQLGQSRRPFLFIINYLQDASYCRLKNLTVGYDFPKSWLSFLHVAKAGVYFSAENLFEFTNVKGAYDPEAAGKNGTMVYPFQRTYSFGLNVTF